MPSIPDRRIDGPLDESGAASIHVDQTGSTLPASPIEREVEHPEAETLGPEGQVPPLPENATPEEKELHWYRHVYQGDRMRQLTLRAVLMGGVLGMFMSISNLYTTLKLGWSFGVAITSCVLSYVIWNTIRGISGNRLTPMTILENNCMQSTASAAGSSTGSTVATAFGALLLITGHHTGWHIVLPFVLFTAALGVFLAIPMKRQMINVEQLAFPSGIAAAETLRSLHSHGREAMKKAISLICGLFTGAFVGFFKAPMGTVAAVDKVYEKLFHIRDLIEFRGWLNPLSRRSLEMQGLGFEPGTLMVAAGAFVGLRVSLSMLAGSVFLYYVVIPLMVSHGALITIAGKSTSYVSAFSVPAGSMVLPTRWALWGGTSIMVFASLTAVALQWRTRARAFNVFGRRQQKTPASAELSNIEVPFWWLMAGVLPIGIGMIIVCTLAFQMSWWLGAIAVAMSFVTSLVASRATGETDTTPTGAMGKITQLLYAVLAHGNQTVNLMSAGVTASASGSAADLLTDLKSGYLLGANPRKQFWAQFLGIFFGVAVIVPAWYLMVPTKEVLLSFNPPATLMWKAVSDALTQGLHTIPITARYAIVIGGLLGIAVPVLSSLVPKAAPYLPSAMGLGLAWVVPFQNSLSFALGALLAWIWMKVHKPTAERYTYPIAAGLIAGESIVLALLAMAATAMHLPWRQLAARLPWR
jgi:OPT family oligopeptide transporter